MLKVIVTRADVTTEEVGEALRQGLGSTRLFRAEVTISRRSEETVLHVIAGGYGLVVRPLNRFWIAERVRRVLQTAPGLRSGATGSGV